MSDPFSGFPIGPISHNTDAELATADALNQHGSDARGHGDRLRNNTTKRAGHGAIGQQFQDLADRMLSAFHDGVANGLGGHLEGTASLLTHNARGTRSTEGVVTDRNNALAKHPHEQSSGGLVDKISSYLGVDLGSGKGLGSGAMVGSKSADEIDRELKEISEDPRRAGQFEGYDWLAGRTPDQFNKEFYKDGLPIWPPNGGAVPGTVHEVTLQKGAIYGRYGSLNGTYLADPKVPYKTLAVAPDSDKTYTEVMVEEEFSAEESTAAEGFGQPGGAKQVKTKPISSLVRNRSLRVLP